MSEELEIFSPAQRCKTEPPSPAAVRAWAAGTDEYCRAETEHGALIRNLQARVWKLERLMKSYGLELIEKQISASADSNKPTKPGADAPAPRKDNDQ